MSTAKGGLGHNGHWALNRKKPRPPPLTHMWLFYIYNLCMCVILCLRVVDFVSIYGYLHHCVVILYLCGCLCLYVFVLCHLVVAFILKHGYLYLCVVFYVWLLLLVVSFLTFSLVFIFKSLWGYFVTFGRHVLCLCAQCARSVIPPC